MADDWELGAEISRRRWGAPPAQNRYYWHFRFGNTLLIMGVLEWVGMELEEYKTNASLNCVFDRLLNIKSNNNVGFEQIELIKFICFRSFDFPSLSLEMDAWM